MKLHSLLIGLFFILGCFSSGVLAQGPVGLPDHDRQHGLKVLNEGFSTDERLYFRAVGDQQDRLFLIQVQHLETGHEFVIPVARDATGIQPVPVLGDGTRAGAGAPGGARLVHMSINDDWSSNAVLNSGGMPIGFLHVNNVTGDSDYVSVK